jgi:ribosome recycling factor
MLEKIYSDVDSRMKKSLEAFAQELAKIRTGRAHPSLVDHIRVDYYGQHVPLSQVASITIEDARTLSLNIWDKSAIEAVEKAILTSDLGLNPAVAGTVVRIPLPPLTEERRKDLIKVVRAEGETARVSVRNIRRDANSQVKELLKTKDISEDEEHVAEERIQKLTDKFIKDIENSLQHKETELMEI